jgi:hypothetical protein
MTGSPSSPGGNGWRYVCSRAAYTDELDVFIDHERGAESDD